MSVSMANQSVKTVVREPVLTTAEHERIGTAQTGAAEKPLRPIRLCSSHAISVRAFYLGSTQMLRLYRAF